MSQSGSSHERVRLPDEMASIFRERGNLWMSRHELADLVNARGRYPKHDGSEVTDLQIHGRARHYPHLFEHTGLISMPESVTRRPSLMVRAYARSEGRGDDSSRMPASRSAERARSMASALGASTV